MRRGVLAQVKSSQVKSSQVKSSQGARERGALWRQAYIRAPLLWCETAVSRSLWFNCHLGRLGRHQLTRIRTLRPRRRFTQSRARACAAGKGSPQSEILIHFSPAARAVPSFEIESRSGMRNREHGKRLSGIVRASAVSGFVVFLSSITVIYSVRNS